MTSILGTQLPENWSTTPLKHVTSFLNRGSAPDYVDEGPVRAVSQAANQDAGLDWDRTRFHNFTGDATKLKGYLRPDDILVNSTGTGTLGRIGFFQGSPDGIPCMADSHVTIARTIPSTMDARFAFYWLRSRPFQEYIYAALTVGATNQIELNRERLGDAPMPVPLIEEQRRIAEFLDAELVKMDTLSGHLRRFDRDIVEREEALLHGTLDSSASTPGCELPETWRWVPLAHLTDYLRPIMYGIVLPGPHSPGGVPIVKGGDVAANRLTLDDLNRTTHEIECKYARSRLKGGDLVVAIRGSVGEIARVPAELTGANLTQDAARVSINDEVNPLWLESVLTSPIVSHQIQQKVTGATIKGINIWDLKRVLIPTPSRAEQDQLALTISKELTLHESIRQKISRHDILLKERRAALITAAVTGQFDVSTASGRGVGV